MATVWDVVREGLPIGARVRVSGRWYSGYGIVTGYGVEPWVNVWLTAEQRVSPFEAHQLEATRLTRRSPFTVRRTRAKRRARRRDEREARRTEALVESLRGRSIADVTFNGQELRLTLDDGRVIEVDYYAEYCDGDSGLRLSTK